MPFATFNVLRPITAVVGGTSRTTTNLGVELRIFGFETQTSDVIQDSATSVVTLDRKLFLDFIVDIKDDDILHNLQDDSRWRVYKALKFETTMILLLVSSGD